MMIRPVNINSTTFSADTKSVNPVTGEYRDPLMRWPLRGMAFTNEVGEALRPLIGEYATLSWAPALLYIGADVYDKYKNDQTEYSPNSRRCLKQAIFQGLASIILPIVAVKTGQNLFSLFGLHSKDNITINTKEHITKLAQDFVANGKLHAYNNRDEECVREFLDIVHNNIGSSENKVKRLSYSKNRKNMHKYAENTIKEVIKMRKDLLKPQAPFDTSVWYENYQNALKKGQTSNVAVKSVLNKYLQNKTLSGKFIKTLGGFLALGIAIKPIDHFVESILIGKIAGPAIDKKKNR